MWNLIVMTLRTNVWIMIEIGGRAVVLWAKIIMLLGSAVMHILKGGWGVRVRAVMELDRRINVLLGDVMVGRAIVLWRWTAVLRGMSVRSLSQL